MKKKLIFATGNEGKMKEIREILGDLDYEILSMKEAGVDVDIVEDGTTFEENAIIKAKTVLEATGSLVLADDSGLEVDYLNKEPGVYSARYMGENTSYPVSYTHLDVYKRQAEYGGLDFSLKWNMGWMHDFLEYMKLDPYFRKYNHTKMNFAMVYAYSENYMLVLSHDEVVHLKCSMIEKMPGSYEDKFKNLMAGYAFMTGHPGKKLLFMGQDLSLIHI